MEDRLLGSVDVEESVKEVSDFHYLFRSLPAMNRFRQSWTRCAAITFPEIEPIPCPLSWESARPGLLYYVSSRRTRPLIATELSVYV